MSTSNVAPAPCAETLQERAERILRIHMPWLFEPLCEQELTQLAQAQSAAYVHVMNGRGMKGEQ